MKKQLLLGIVILIIGLIIGNKVYTANTSLSTVFQEGTTYYFLQEGVYTSKVILNENTKNIDVKVIDEKDNKYYVYLGITKSETIAQKLKAIYEEEGYQIYIKEMKFENEEFENNLTQFDLLINSATTKEEIMTIEEVVLASYEEIIKNQ